MSDTSFKSSSFAVDYASFYPALVARGTRDGNLRVLHWPLNDWARERHICKTVGETITRAYSEWLNEYYV